MAIERRLSVRCDWPSCWAVRDTYASMSARARAKAAEAGWVRVEGHFCGPESNRQGRDGWAEWSGHAAQVETHRPAPEERRSEYGSSYKAACSCGWVDDSPLRHTRQNARGRWRRHLPPGVQATDQTSAAESRPTDRSST